MFHMDVWGHLPFNAFVNYLRNSFECSRYLLFVYDIETFRNVNLLELIMSWFCLFLARQPPVGQGLLIHGDSRSHTTTHHSR